MYVEPGNFVTMSFTVIPQSPASHSTFAISASNTRTSLCDERARFLSCLSCSSPASFARVSDAANAKDVEPEVTPIAVAPLIYIKASDEGGKMVSGE